MCVLRVTEWIFSLSKIETTLTLPSQEAIRTQTTTSFLSQSPCWTMGSQPGWRECLVIVGPPLHVVVSKLRNVWIRSQRNTFRISPFQQLLFGYYFVPVFLHQILLTFQHWHNKVLLRATYCTIDNRIIYLSCLYLNFKWTIFSSWPLVSLLVS